MLRITLLFYDFVSMYSICNNVLAFCEHFLELRGHHFINLKLKCLLFINQSKVCLALRFLHIFYNFCVIHTTSLVFGRYPSAIGEVVGKHTQ